MTDEGCEREPIEELAEEFVARLRRGEKPSVSDYADRHPELAPRIRDLFPTLVMMERFGDPENSSLVGLGEKATDGPPQRRLGEYRILREIGRGGMGIVYEAEQESLGRHVALKVLASHWRLDAKQLKRFEREARAVAKLQHPNIVPVYASGQHKGVPYYVMQFIRGQGLDGVLQELRTITGARHGPAPVDDIPPTLASQVARRLVQVGHPGLAMGADSIDVAITDWHERTSPDAAGEPRLTTAQAPHAAAKSTVAALAGQTEAAGRSSSSIYFQSVARIGAQVADALAYAHEQGILHRDIKPSNLLVDDSGAVWITDFGLAKATTEDNLTDSGDMVGTLRYMAPEQLRGWADPRSDVYGLGITLYELLALRPAFLATDRAQLMSQVLGENPPRLRKLCRNVPFDLETVVHKSMAKEPEQRYVNAGELAADLRRFMEGQPIKARRTPFTTWLWLWSRRNPLVASLLVCLCLILTTALGLVTYLWQDAESERQAVVVKNQENRQLLGEAYLAQAKALRSSRRPERRREALAVLAKAAGIGPTVDARNEAIAALTLPGIERVRRWQTAPDQYSSPCFDATLERHAAVQGRMLTIRSTANDQVLLSQELPAELLPVVGRVQAHAFLPDLRGVILWVQRPGRVNLVAWDLEAQKTSWVSPPLVAPVFSFGSQYRYAAVNSRPDLVEIADMKEGIVVSAIEPGAAVERMAFSPDGALLAVATDKSQLFIYDWRQGTCVSRSLQAPDIMDLNWSPDGKCLAAGSADFRASVWKCEGKDELALRAVLAGHQAEVTGARYSPDGELLATTSWDGTTILWEVHGLRELSQLPGNILAFSADSRRLVTKANLDSSFSIWELQRPIGLYRLKGHAPIGKGPKEVDVSTDGRLLASASIDGVRLWDLQARKHLLLVSSVSSCSVRFHPNGEELLSCGRDGVQVWPLKREPELKVGGGRALTRVSDFSRLTQDASGRTLAAVDWNRQTTLLFNDDRREDPRLLTGHKSVREAVLSPNGQWLATATWHGQGIRLWNGQTGEFVQDIYPESGTALIAFSPDGRWFMAGTGAEYRLWQVDGWQLQRTFPRTQGGNIPGPIAFSQDASLMAICPTIHTIQLVNTETGKELATLEAPDLDILTWLRFTADGSHLVCGTENQIIQLWDLRELNDALAPLMLNWK